MFGATVRKTGDSITNPPDNSCRVIALPSGPFGVWQLPQATTLFIRYAPRSSHAFAAMAPAGKAMAAIIVIAARLKFQRPDAMRVPSGDRLTYVTDIVVVRTLLRRPATDNGHEDAFGGIGRA